MKDLLKDIDSSKDIVVIKELMTKIALKNQELEDRINKLENSEFSTGVYLSGVNEKAKEYIKRDGEK